MRTKVRARWVVKVAGGVKAVVLRGQGVKRGQELAKGERREVRLFELGKWFKKIRGMETIKGRKFKKGEVIWQERGWGGWKLAAPVEGVCRGVDEFGNLLLETEIGEKQKLLSPVEAKVVRVENEEIALEFMAWEFKGEGIGQGRGWVEGRFDLKTRLSDLDWRDEDRVIFYQKINLSVINKAEVIGVGGVVGTGEITDELERIKVDFPIIVLDGEEMGELGKVVGEGKDQKMLLDAAGGRILVI